MIQANRILRKANGIVIQFASLALCTCICVIVITACLLDNSTYLEAKNAFGGEYIVYPSDANFVNVQDYGAKGNGEDDDTNAIRLAIQENLNQHKTLFFPAGTYLISDMLEWKNEDDVFYAFLTFQGEGTTKTIIKLKDRAPGFTNSQSPKPMIRPGSIESGEDGTGNRAHSNYILDMTFDVGVDNPGAIGVDFIANNTGAMENVVIQSSDGQGAVGLNLTREVGPCLIKKVTVKGFDIGILTSSALYSITLEKIQLESQNVVGLKNIDNVLAIRRLTSINSVPAIINEGQWTGPIVLIDSELRGGSPQSTAIENSSEILVRNIIVDGYKHAIQSGDTQVPGPKVAEFVSSPPLNLFQSSLETLNLPIEETPEFSSNDLTEWANVETYGAVRDDELDDAQGIQAAIDSGKPIVYFPQGTYKFNTPVIVRGNVRRIIGFQSALDPTDILFKFDGIDHPVILERFSFNGGKLERQTSQPIVVRHSTNVNLTGTVPGTWFIENIVAKPINLNKGQKVYARQLNSELPPPLPMVTNDGGLFWVLGYKTEFGNTVLATRNSGQTEILGGLFYPAQGLQDSETPLLINQDSVVSATYREIAFGPTYNIHVEETHQGTTKLLKRATLGEGAMVSIPLYVGRQ